jgi:hypothetical protein
MTGVVCWGDQSSGQRDIEPMDGFVQLAASDYYTGEPDPSVLKIE